MAPRSKAKGKAVVAEVVPEPVIAVVQETLDAGIPKEWREARASNAVTWFEQSKTITWALYLESLKQSNSGQTQAVKDAVLAAERKIILENFIISQIQQRQKLETILQDAAYTRQMQPQVAWPCITPVRQLVVLHTEQGGFQELLFVRSLVGTLLDNVQAGDSEGLGGKHNLSGSVWSLPLQDRLQVQDVCTARLLALSRCSVALIILTPSYMASPAFAGEQALLLSRLDSTDLWQAAPLHLIQVQLPDCAFKLVTLPFGFPSRDARSSVVTVPSMTHMSVQDLEASVGTAMKSLRQPLQNAGVVLSDAIHIQVGSSAGKSQRAAALIGCSTSILILSRPSSAPVGAGPSSIAAHLLPTPHRRKPLEDWTVHDVHSWLRSLGKTVSGFGGLFLLLGVDGALLSTITEDDLRGVLGVRVASIRRSIMAARERIHNITSTLTATCRMIPEGTLPPEGSMMSKSHLSNRCKDVMMFYNTSNNGKLGLRQLTALLVGCNVVLKPDQLIDVMLYYDTNCDERLHFEEAEFLLMDLWRVIMARQDASPSPCIIANCERFSLEAEINPNANIGTLSGRHSKSGPISKYRRRASTTHPSNSSTPVNNPNPAIGLHMPGNGGDRNSPEWGRVTPNPSPALYVKFLDTPQERPSLLSVQSRAATLRSTQLRSPYTPYTPYSEGSSTLGTRKDVPSRGASGYASSTPGLGQNLQAGSGTGNRTGLQSRGVSTYASLGSPLDTHTLDTRHFDGGNGTNSADARHGMQSRGASSYANLGSTLDVKYADTNNASGSVDLRRNLQSRGPSTYTVLGSTLGNKHSDVANGAYSADARQSMQSRAASPGPGFHSNTRQLTNSSSMEPRHGVHSRAATAAGMHTSPNPTLLHTYQPDSRNAARQDIRNSDSSGGADGGRASMLSRGASRTSLSMYSGVSTPAAMGMYSAGHVGEVRSYEVGPGKTPSPAQAGVHGQDRGRYLSGQEGVQQSLGRQSSAMRSSPSMRSSVNSPNPYVSGVGQAGARDITSSLSWDSVEVPLEPSTHAAPGSEELVRVLSDILHTVDFHRSGYVDIEQLRAAIASGADDLLTSYQLHSLGRTSQLMHIRSPAGLLDVEEYADEAVEQLQENHRKLYNTVYADGGSQQLLLMCYNQVANREEPDFLDKVAASASLEVLLVRSKMLDVSCMVKMIMLMEAEKSAAAAAATAAAEGAKSPAIAVWSTKLAHMVHVYNELLGLC